MKNSFFKLLLLLMPLAFTSCGYNSMVEKQENVEMQWAQVENAYQRRADLIPNLVNTVKGYARHESQTLENVVNARARATSINLNAEQLTEENLRKFQEAQASLSTSLGRLMAVAESYPDLKANKNFLALQQQLEGTENRISVERRKYNEAVADYNKYIKKIPQNLIAGWFNFSPKPFFQAKEGTDTPPAVNFE